MTDLFITPTRRALLKDVADGHIHRVAGPYNPDNSIDYDARDGSRVTAQMRRLHQAGLVTLHDTTWRLTDTGRTAVTNGDTT